MATIAFRRPTSSPTLSPSRRMSLSTGIEDLGIREAFSVLYRALNRKSSHLDFQGIVRRRGGADGRANDGKAILRCFGPSDDGSACSRG